jgi:hypothetical protein
VNQTGQIKDIGFMQARQQSGKIDATQIADKHRP